VYSLDRKYQCHSAPMRQQDIQMSKVSNNSKSQSEPLIESLTQRELDIVSLIAKGMTNRQIGDALHLAEPTVRWHNTQIFDKLGVKNRSQAVARVQELGLLVSEKELPATTRHNLPWQTTMFVGRDQEMRELAHLLDSDEIRLITILGAGGMGKTRLALETARTHLSRFEDGVFFIPLAPLNASRHILRAIAEQIGFQFINERDQQAQLIDFLTQKRMLLVLDNFEHLLESARLVASILGAALGVTILATSRQKLSLSSETIYTVSGMSFPSKEAADDIQTYSAVGLFTQSAQRTRPDFTLNDEDLRHVAHICQLVEGMPLALLLAATWVDVLSLEEIGKEIGQGLDLLQTDQRDISIHQRSVRATFDRSWARLNPAERAIFLQLAVFRGGFTRLAIQTVTEASLPALQALVNKSLLWRTQEGRYYIHELLRQYGAEKIAKDEQRESATRTRHSAYYCTFLKDRETALKSAGVLAALKEIETEINNVRIGWEWAAKNLLTDNLLGAAASLGWYYFWLGSYYDGEAAYRIALERVEAENPNALWASGRKLRIWTVLLAWQSNFMNEMGRYKKAADNCRKALDLLGKPVLAGQDTRPEEAFILEVLAGTTNWRDPATTLKSYRHSLALYRELGDRWGTAFVLARIGETTIEDHHYEAGEVLCLEALELAVTLGHPLQQVWPLISLGRAVALQERPEEGQKWVQQAVEISRTSDHKPGLYYAKNYWGDMSVRRGEFSEAYTALVDNMSITSTLNTLAAWGHLVLSVSLLHMGRYGAAEGQARTMISHFEQRHEIWEIAFGHFILACVKLAQGNQNEAQHLFQKSAKIHREIENNFDLSYVLAARTYIAERTNTDDQVRQDLQGAVSLALKSKDILHLLFALPAVAFHLAQKGEHERAVEIYALASKHPFVGNSRWFADVVGSRMEVIVATLPADAVKAARERGNKGDVWQTAKSLTGELADLV
jgi:predicted ATPase/DNA-binding CsgD family transcriptional regulator